MFLGSVDERLPEIEDIVR